jgi:hypothetical protein
MKLKLKELQQISENLKQIGQIEIVQTTAYWINRFRDKIESELNSFNDSRNALERRYGSYKYKNGTEVLTLVFKDASDKYGYWVNEKDEKVEGIQIIPAHVYWKAKDDESFDLYMKELEGLENQEITIDFSPIKLSGLVNGRGEAISIRPNLFRGLEALFTE